MAAHLSPESFRFLRGLIRNNDRAWFEDRRPTYERYIKEPLLALVNEINADLADMAPEFVRPAHKVAMRIFRDTRFSPDKRPYLRTPFPAIRARTLALFSVSNCLNKSGFFFKANYRLRQMRAACLIASVRALGSPTVHMRSCC